MKKKKKLLGSVKLLVPTDPCSLKKFSTKPGIKTHSSFSKVYGTSSDQMCSV